MSNSTLCVLNNVPFIFVQVFASQTYTLTTTSQILTTLDFVNSFCRRAHMNRMTMEIAIG